MLPVAIFVAAAFLAFYVSVGYAGLLGLMARVWAKPVSRGRERKTVSVIIAAYNAERFIAEKLDSVLALQYPRELMEIIVVSDGCTDGTDEVVRGYEPRGVRLMRVRHGGKCAALNAAIPEARNEILLLTDARQTVAPDSLQWMVNCFADPMVGAVSGELIIRQPATLDEAEIGLYWRFESWIRNRLSELDSMFGATGPFYAVRRDLAAPIPPDQLLDDMYLPLGAYFKGYRLVVEPRARAFDYPTSRQTEFKRKRRTLAGNFQILRSYPELLGFGNRMWFHFVSYKVGRLMLPWVLIVLFVSSLYLPAPWDWWMARPQMAFYLLALIDPLVPAGSRAGFPLKRATSFARTFCAMMIAAMLGLTVFFVPPRTLWKEATIAVRR